MPDPARKYPQITKAVYDRPWAIQPSMLAVIEEVVRLRVAGAPLTDEQIQVRVAAAENGQRRGATRAQGVAVIPIYGVIAHRMDLFHAMSGGTSVEGIRQAFREAQADPDIGAIVFDVDSPGGMVDGIEELANEIRAARGGKPMAAVANSLMASAAYYLGSAADEVIASPSSQIGSIGVVYVHWDVSKADEMAGEEPTFITTAKYKAEGNAHEPLSDEGRDHIESLAQDYHHQFVTAVAKSRGVSAAKVNADFGQGRVTTAKKAHAAGMVDRVEPLDATLRRLVVAANRSTGAAAHALAAAGLTAQEQVGVLMSTLPIHEQLALLNAEGERVAAHYAKRAELRAKEGKQIPGATREQLAELAMTLETIPSDPDDPDLDTDQPEEAASPKAQEDWRARARFDQIEAGLRGGYPTPHIEVPQS